MPAADLVAGDVVVLAAGDVVPADCRVLSASGLEADESALTGESVPVAKTAEPILASALAERASMLYEGTTVAAGRGRAVVVATGASTEAGRTIAATRRSAPRGGVEARLNEITNVTLPTAVAAAGAVAGAGLLRARPLRDSLGAGVGLAVASVPEGLPFLVNAAQLAAARRLSAIGALVRDPRSIEALGRVDVLCFDKTGTLTAGRITLTAVADATTCRVLASLSARHRRALAAGLRATPQPPPGQQLLHLTDRAVSDGAEAAGVARDHDAPGWQQLMALPFEPSRGYHATLGAVDGRLLLSVKGAPELVLDRCTEYAGKPLTSSVRRRLLTQLHELTARGHRVLAVAEKVESRPSGDVESLEDPGVAGLDFLGFLALADPVRRTAVDALQQLRGAGVQIVMITGDHPGTAAAIADELGLPGDRLTTGADLDALDDRALDALLPDIAVVARSTPAHKIRVVEAFQRLHRVVAMTGDGANDAAAIRLADVGIALGHRGTPAARAAADLVVTDDQLETIVAALVEGRSMWASVRQALGILVGGNLGEIGFTVLAAGVTGSSPLSARQLLLVNLLTDLVPALAIAVRPPTGEPARLLAEGPEVSLGSALTHDIGLRAVVTATGAGLGWGAARLTGRSRRAGTVALVSLVGTQLGQTVVAGRAKPGVVASSVGSAAAQMGVVQTPGVSQFFGCTPIGPVGWAIAGGAAGAATLGGIAVPAFARWARGQADVGRGAPQVPARYAPQATTSVS